MPLPISFEHIKIGTHEISLAVPNPTSVKAQYAQEKLTNTNTPFPYWTQVWPSAIALSKFLVSNLHYIENKVVLELAAGLGLPSIVASHYALSVICTDYLPEAISIIAQSIHSNELTNMTCSVLDWQHLHNPLPQVDVLLASDINYNPESFGTIYKALHQFLLNGTTIILSTPQRLSARPFVEMILPFCRNKIDFPIDNDFKSLITLMILKI